MIHTEKTVYQLLLLDGFEMPVITLDHVVLHVTLVDVLHSTDAANLSQTLGQRE